MSINLKTRAPPVCGLPTAKFWLRLCRRFGILLQPCMLLGSRPSVRGWGWPGGPWSRRRHTRDLNHRHFLLVTDYKTGWFFLIQLPQPQLVFCSQVTFDWLVIWWINQVIFNLTVQSVCNVLCRTVNTPNFASFKCCGSTTAASINNYYMFFYNAMSSPSAWWSWRSQFFHCITQLVQQLWMETGACWWCNVKETASEDHECLHLITHSIWCSTVCPVIFETRILFLFCTFLKGLSCLFHVCVF